MTKFTRKQKIGSVLQVFRVKILKLPYIILGLFFYPFINRTKVRNKFYSGKYNWWTLQLWLMLNDDELGKEKNKGFDFDVAKVEEQGIDYSTKWGEFKASYWFNPWRNGGYNYSIYNGPIKTIEYSNQEVEIDDIVDVNKKQVDPLLRAEWVWINKFGKIDNRGVKISDKKTKLGTGLVWFNPNNDITKLYYRYSKATLFKFLFIKRYVTIQTGHFGNKFDIIIKFQKPKKNK